MTNRLTTHLSFLIVCISLVGFLGCGGGGGGGDATFAGVYRVALGLFENECPFNADAIFTTTHTVNQDGDRIVVNSGTEVLDGVIDEDGKGFTVVRQERTADCLIRQGFNYTESESGDADFDVALLQISQCGRLECSTSYLGVANQQ